MNTELLEALTILEKEKEISKETLLDAIENSLINACKNHFGKADNIKVVMNRETCEYSLYAEKTVVEEVEDPLMEVSLAEAKMKDAKIKAFLNDSFKERIDSKMLENNTTNQHALVFDVRNLIQTSISYI